MHETTVKGAVAGTVGVWIMDVVTWLLYREQPRATIAREKRVRVFGKNPAHAAARRLATLAGSHAAKSEPNAAGIFVHYLLGIGPGIVYANLWRTVPAVTAANGAVWGVGLYVANDLWPAGCYGSCARSATTPGKLMSAAWSATWRSRWTPTRCSRRSRTPRNTPGEQAWPIVRLRPSHRPGWSPVLTGRSREAGAVTGWT